MVFLEEKNGQYFLFFIQLRDYIPLAPGIEFGSRLWKRENGYPDRCIPFLIQREREFATKRGSSIFGIGIAWLIE